MTGIINRKGTYYYRQRIPTDLRHHFDRRHLRRSLHTKDANAAKALGASFAAKVHHAFAMLRTGALHPAEAKALVANLLAVNLAEVVASTHQHSPQPCHAENRTSLALHSAEPVAHLEPVLAPLTLGLLVERFVDEHLARHKWTEKTCSENRAILTFCVELLGDVPLTGLSRQQMIWAVGALQRLPANRQKIPAYRGKPISGLLKMHIADPMSASTVNKYLSRLSATFKWGVASGYLTHNPAESLFIDKPTRPDEERLPYTPDELDRLLASVEVYRVSRPDHYWIPRLALFAGLRLNECCQLHVSDVRKVEGVWCIDVNESGVKRLKTKSARRLIPVHPALLKWRFMDFVLEMESAGEERLWPDLRHSRDGFSKEFGRWFQGHNRHYVTQDERKTFHSLRHCFAGGLKVAKVDPRIVAQLLGHSMGNPMAERYGEPYAPAVLVGAVEAVTFPVSF